MKWASTPTLVYWGLNLLAVSIHARFIPSGQQVIAAEGALQYESFTHEHSGELRRYEWNGELLRLLHDLDVDVWASTPAYIDAYFPSNLDSHAKLTPYFYSILPLNVPTVLEAPLKDAEISPKPLVLSDLKSLNSTFHEDYHSSGEISTFLQELANAFPETTSFFHIGNSFEGRPLEGVKIAKPQDGKQLRNFVILGPQHAREWIAASTSLYLAHALSVDPSEQHPDHAGFTLGHLLDFYEFHIIPNPNPDGYEYTRTNDRLWYKNRQVVSHDGKVACTGIDMDSNWGYKWRRAPNPCSPSYPGTRPFESIEVNALATYITNRIGGRGKAGAFLDLRAYGQLLSTPYSYSCQRYPPDAEDLIEAALGAAQASFKIHGHQFTTGRLCETLYSSPGNVIDWTYVNEGIKYSYAAHLRDTGVHGYLIPKEFIRPTAEETTALVNYLARFIAKDTKVPYPPRHVFTCRQ